MSDGPAIDARPAPASASRSRGSARVELVVLHSNPDPADAAIDAYTAPGAIATPHFYVDAQGAISALVPEGRAARHSGRALWRGRHRLIDLVSIGIALEHTPGAAYPPALLTALNALLLQVRMRQALGPESLFRWEPSEQGLRDGPGVLIAVELPPIPLLVAAPVPEALVLGDDGALIDDEATCVPPPTPELGEPEPMVLGAEAAVLGVEDDPQTAQRFWSFLAQEAYRQRGEGFRADWAFHLHAARNGLGAPLATSARTAEQVVFGGKRYGFQVFAGDTLFNEIPKYGEVQSLNNTLGGTIAASGLARLLLEASYRATAQALHANYAFHATAVRERLGPPLSGNYRVAANGQHYAIQVFARDTLFTPIATPESATQWGDVRRLSDLGDTPGELRERLWEETYKPCGAPYQAAAAFQQLAAREKLGAPLTGLYQVEFEGVRYDVQVFAGDILYSNGNDPRRHSALPRPDSLGQPGGPAPGGGATPDPADANRRPVFALLPVPTGAAPRVSQFYGYTKYSKKNASRFYSATQGRHSGLDIGIKVGTPLLAIEHGVVFCAGRPKVDCPWGGAPPMVIIVRYGDVYAVYGHASVVHVAKGQVVRPGELLGLSGEYPAGSPHLHFEVRPVSNPVQAYNPVPYFTPELQQAYFAPQLGPLGGLNHFCCGTYAEQPVIEFGKPIDDRPCER